MGEGNILSRLFSKGEKTSGDKQQIAHLGDGELEEIATATENDRRNRERLLLKGVNVGLLGERHVDNETTAALLAHPEEIGRYADIQLWEKHLKEKKNQ